MTVINDILDFSKIEAGKLAVDVVPFDLNDSVDTAVKLLATRAHAKGLELAYEIRPDVPTALLGDPSRLRQVITNLVGNAIKFTEHGEVVLTVEAETQTDDEATLRFSVSDTGIGIPQEQQEAIFKPFIQADGSTTRKYGGTGLGLAISTNLVALLGGRIWLESETGKGSTFHFTVRFDLQKASAPATASREAQTEQPPGHAGPRRGRQRRQPADPRGDAQTLAHETCAGREWTGRTGRHAGQQDGRKGLSPCLARRSDAGHGRILRGRRDQEGPELAGATLVMLTSAGRQGDGARCRELGIAAYLMKPISQSELLEAILAGLGTPSADPDRLQVVTRHSLRESRPKLRILLAEDNSVNQLVAARLLEKRGHTVVIAGNGREALAALDEPGSGGFDLVLMDVQMPEMDGFEATGIIRAREKSSGTHLPIIAMTAHTMKGDEERCLAAGMDGYVSKPIQVEQLFAAIGGITPVRDAVIG